MIAELGFLFTRNGRDWWQMRIKQDDSITFKLIQHAQITDAEDKFIQMWNLEKSLLLLKLDEVSAYLQFDSENVKKAILSWLSIHDSFIDDLMNYWKTNMTATITFNNEAIKMNELC